MLLVGSKLLDFPVMSLHVGGEVARTAEAIIDPAELKVVAYTLSGPLLSSGEYGDILETSDIREVSNLGMIVDSTDVFSHRSEVIRLDKIMSLNFELVGLRVVSEDGKKLGKVSDYTIDADSFTVYQLIVRRPFLKSALDPELTINRSQIVEIDDYKIIIKHEKENVPVQEQAKEFVPNFVNPFREPNYVSESTKRPSSSHKTD